MDKKDMVMNSKEYCRFENGLKDIREAIMILFTEGKITHMTMKRMMSNTTLLEKMMKNNTMRMFGIEHKLKMLEESKE